jgi:hypothetical protein
LLLITVDAIEVLIKYCTNSFPQVDQFIYKKIDQLPVTFRWAN